MNHRMDRDNWGEWECPVCRDGKRYNDPNCIRGTVCDNNHVILLGPVRDGYRWAEEIKPASVASKFGSASMHGCL